MSNYRKVGYIEQPGHKYAHVVEVNGDSAYINEKTGELKVEYDTLITPSHWNFVDDDVMCGVHHTRHLNVRMLPNTIQRESLDADN